MIYILYMYAQADVVVASRTDDQRRNNETTAGAQWHNERKTCKSLKIPASPREVETAARRTWSVYGQTKQTKFYPASPHVCMLEAPEQQRMKRTQLGSRWLYNRRLRGTRTTKSESHVKTMCGAWRFEDAPGTPRQLSVEWQALRQHGVQDHPAAPRVRLEAVVPLAANDSHTTEAAAAAAPRMQRKNNDKNENGGRKQSHENRK